MLRQLLETCVNDTRRFVNVGAANRLSAYAQYDDDELIVFVQRMIRVRANQANGFLIHSQHGISLESIVAIHLPEMFLQEDIVISRNTLGIH